MKTILDRSFQYVPSADTDLRKTFARIRRKLKEQEEARARADAEVTAKVSLIQRSKTALTA